MKKGKIIAGLLFASVIPVFFLKEKIET